MRIVVTLLAAVVVSGCGTDDPAARDRIRAEIEGARTPEYAAGTKHARQLWTSTRDFYRARAFAPVWLQQGRATPKMEALVGSVRGAARDGLDPLLYDIGFVDEGNRRRRFSEEDASSA